MNLKDKKSMPIEDTVECVEALAKIVKDNDLGKIRISSDDIEIVIEGKKCPPPMPVPMPLAAAPAAVAAAPVAEAAPAVEEVKGNIVTAPIVGTMYSAPAPDKAPFVTVGATVNAGDVICIIESMKVMNEITSEFSGRVAEIYVSNGEAVEYGQKLMRIE